MKQEHYNELEAWATRELKALPRHRAPDQLMQRVRAAIATARTAPVCRPVTTWSPRSRFLALAACALSLVAFCWFAAGNPAFATLTSNLQAAFASVTESTGGALAILDAIILVLRKVGQPALLTALLVFAALGAFCAGLGTVCFRFVIAEKEN